jgi:hypothetical protein
MENLKEFAENLGLYYKPDPECIFDCKKAPTYRYFYSSNKNEENQKRIIFIMLNPSKTGLDGQKDDQTVQNCTKIAKKEGYGRIKVLNLFPLINGSRGKAIQKINNLSQEDFAKISNLNSQIINKIMGEITPYGTTVVFAWGKDGDNEKFKDIRNEILKIISEKSIPVWEIKVNDIEKVNDTNYFRHPSNSVWNHLGTIENATLKPMDKAREKQIFGVKT